MSNRVYELLKLVSDKPLTLIDELDNTRAALINTVAMESYLQGMKDAFAIMVRDFH